MFFSLTPKWSLGDRMHRIVFQRPETALWTLNRDSSLLINHQLRRDLGCAFWILDLTSEVQQWLTRDLVFRYERFHLVTSSTPVFY